MKYIWSNSTINKNIERRLVMRIRYRSLSFLFLISLLPAINNPFAADPSLQFPMKQREIEEALGGSKEPGSGLRTRGIMQSRGVGGVVSDLPTPKVGAMINFDYNSAKIRPESYALIDEFGKAFSGKLDKVVFIVAGYTDADGSETYNIQLSYNRAKAVADYLITRHSIPGNRLIINGYGKDNPIADNVTQEGKAKNRRVEFIRQN